MRPDLTRVPTFFHGYISHVKEDDLMEAFRVNTGTIMKFLENIPADKYAYRYAEGKWTVQEVLQHLIDAERVFAYRALRFARFDPTPLPGFDENLFAENARAETRPWHTMLDEFKCVRQSSFYLFDSFDAGQLEGEGVSNGHKIYVLGIGYILIGHPMHHMRVLKERYF